MPSHSQDPSAPVDDPATVAELVLATREQEPILSQLLELYIHDFSELLDIDVGDDGRFGYPGLSSYWSDPDRHPFLVRADGKHAGLILIKRDCKADYPTWDVAEFFVLRAYRRQGLGSEIAHQLWRRFPGPWQVRVLESNVAGSQFWSCAISAFLGQRCEPAPIHKDGLSWQYFSFSSEKVVDQRGS